MLGQSALLRIRVVGMSVSVNSSSRSTTYAILPGRKSSFLSWTPDLKITLKMFLPEEEEEDTMKTTELDLSHDQAP